MVTAPAIRALGFLSPRGRGGAMPPEKAGAGGAWGAVLTLGRPAAAGDRFRRATRECLLAVAAVDAMLEDGRVGRDAIAGDRTALLYVTAAAYAASNRAFIERGAGGAYFPYTAPAAVPAEVAIEFGLTGPYSIFIGGSPATLEAIWHGASLLEAGACDRALVLTVETFEECVDLYSRQRRLTGWPLVEAAGCLWLEPGAGTLALECRRGRARPPDEGAHRPPGEMLACGPLAAVALWRAGGHREPLRLCGAWRGEVVELTWMSESRRPAGTAARGGDP